MDEEEKKEEKKTGSVSDETRQRKINIFDDVRMDLIDKVTRKQKNKQISNMLCDKKNRQEIEPILFIYDDMLGSSQLKSWNS